MGEAFARILSLNGAHVAVCDLDRSAATRVADRINESGGAATAYEVDVSDPRRVEQLVGEILELRGKIDVLVNNAGVLRPTAFPEVTESEWRMVMKVNVDGVFYCCRYVAPSMVFVHERPRPRWCRPWERSMTAMCRWFGWPNVAQKK